MTPNNNLVQIENRTGRLKLNDTVHKESADKLIQELETLYGIAAVAAKMQIGEIVCSADDALTTVEVEINTNGGSVMEGQRIYNTLRGVSNRGVEVKTIVNGMAASMGSVILMAGDHRSITHGSRVMIHEASTMAWGDARVLRTQSELLEGISSEIAAIYAERTGGDPAELRELMLKETYMDAATAKDLGFVHVVIKDGKEGGDKASALKSDYSITNKKTTLMFSKDKVLVAKFEASQAEVAEHEATITAREDEIKNLSERLADVNGQLETANSTIKDSEKEITDLKADIETAGTENGELTAKIADLQEKQTDFDAKVSAAAAVKVAEMGIPEPVEASEDDSENLLVSREAFNALSPRDRTEFSKKGGKIQTS